MKSTENKISGFLVPRAAAQYLGVALNEDDSDEDYENRKDLKSSNDQATDSSLKDYHLTMQLKKDHENRPLWVTPGSKSSHYQC